MGSITRNKIDQPHSFTMISDRTIIDTGKARTSRDSLSTKSARSASGLGDGESLHDWLKNKDIYCYYSNSYAQETEWWSSPCHRSAIYKACIIVLERMEILMMDQYIEPRLSSQVRSSWMTKFVNIIIPTSSSIIHVAMRKKFGIVIIDWRGIKLQ